jgi:hypothetical protein
VTSAADRLIFALINAWFCLTRRRFVVRCRRHFGFWPNLATPRRVGELLQWRKLMDRNPSYVIFADKLATKAWIAARQPDLAMSETLWVGQRPEDIPDALLTPGHVIKTNNASGQNYLPHRKPLSRAEVNRQFRRWLRASAAKRWLGWLDQAQEWAYWPVAPKIFVERQVDMGEQLVDISIRVLDGRALLASCALDFKTEASVTGYFWPDGVRIEDPNTKLPTDFVVPASFFEAVRRAEQLGQGFDYLRIDFFGVGNRLYAGEITCYPASGLGDDTWYLQKLYQCWLQTLDISWPLSTRQPWPRMIYLEAFRRWLRRRRVELDTETGPLPANGSPNL